MKPSDQLKQEHEAVKLALKILDKIAKNLETGDEVNPQDLESLMEFIKVFVDKCHHTKEEKIFYPLAGEIEWAKENGPIAMMLTEHDLGRECVKEMSSAVHRYKDGEKDASFVIIQKARDYIALLNDHIAKEDDILYPLIDAQLSEAQEKEIEEKFESLERDVIGEGKHEEFHRLLDRLKDLYL